MLDHTCTLKKSISVPPGNLRASAIWTLTLTLTVTQATIDQVDGLLSFNAGSEPMLQWDEQIHSVCAQLNSIIDDAISRRAGTVA